MPIQFRKSRVNCFTHAGRTHLARRINVGNLLLLSTVAISTAAAQSMRVDVTKRANNIPEACRLILPASLAEPINLQALVKEAICKGAGDMLIEFTYVMHVDNRELGKKGAIKKETTTYEVFIPTLKSGLGTRGILLVTNHNGVAVPPDELEKDRLKTGERLEEEENKIDRIEAPPPQAISDGARGLLPVGMYLNTSMNRGSFGMRRGGARVAINDFLETCELTLLRRQQTDGRELLIFSFSPRPDARFDFNTKYITQLTGEISIDAADRIVTRLAGWPRDAQPGSPGKPPAVYAEMMRLREGLWLPRLIRINGLDYPRLFDHITTDTTWTYSNYIHFSTEIKEVKVNSAKP